MPDQDRHVESGDRGETDPGLTVLGWHVIVYYMGHGYDGWSMAGRSTGLVMDL